jgi:SAM-dependent methyltransferase
VVGLDASQVMLDAAAIRAPSAQLVLGDLADFDLSRRFDAIVCLFSSLGYLRDTGRLRSAAASIARHLNREGIVLVEPWLTAEQFGTGRISVDTGQSAHRTVARITRSSVVDGRAVLATDYLVAEADVTEHITERHEMTLFAHADYLEGMRTAGLDAQLDGDADRPGAA